MRTLENNIKKILRKLTLEIVRQNEQVLPKKRKIKKEAELPVKVKASYTITPEELPKYLGKPLFHSDRIYEITPVGICAGLAWTSMGGATLYVESIKIPGEKTEMKLTGQAGQVMKESSEIAWSYLHGAVHKYAPGHTFFEKSQVHIHIPEGATPKDGPSAGITMVTSLLSLLRGEPVAQDLCMTGELTLTGRVLPIGGVKEKIVAAKRAGLKIVIFPSDNLRDIEELSADIKQGINIHFVEHYDEVFKIAFPEGELPAI